MSDRLKDILDAIECCRANERCSECPLAEEICDEIWVDMVTIPEALMYKIEAELADKMKSNK